jgi:hypothetical protein
LQHLHNNAYYPGVSPNPHFSILSYQVISGTQRHMALLDPIPEGQSMGCFDVVFTPLKIAVSSQINALVLRLRNGLKLHNRTINSGCVVQLFALVSFFLLTTTNM